MDYIYIDLFLVLYVLYILVCIHQWEFYIFFKDAWEREEVEVKFSNWHRIHLEGKHMFGNLFFFNSHIPVMCFRDA